MNGRPSDDETNRSSAGKPPSLSRRRILAGSSAAVAALAGCLGGGDDSGSDEDGDDGSTPSTPDVTDSEDVPRRPQVTDPPEAVYLPTHRESMVRLDPVEAGPYTVTPMLSYPHTFWLVTGTETEEVRPQGPGIHLMFTVRDTETGTVLPVDVGSQTRLLRDGEVVDRRAPWPMISQPMGFHFGDNVALDEQGRYTVEIDLSPITVRRTGAFAGRFETGRTVSFEFEFDREFQRQIVEGAEFLDEQRWGERGALEPMGGMGGMGDGDDSGMDGHGMAYSALPPAESYPGRSLDEPTSGDARFVVRYLPDGGRNDGGLLLVSPRTPYNRVPLADMALSVSGAVEGELVQTLDSEVGLYYGISADLSPGETVEFSVDSPPQVARHEGYETTFLDMPPMTVEVPE